MASPKSLTDLETELAHSVAPSNGHIRFADIEAQYQAMLHELEAQSALRADSKRGSSGSFSTAPYQG